ncbi:hypothetical protein Tco_0945735, partial [Tanacetum coccineum]
MNHLDNISQAGVNERAKLLKTLNKVAEIIEADYALKEAMKKMVESNNTTSGNITKEPEFHQRLLRAAKGYIQNSTRLTQIANSLQAINLPKTTKEDETEHIKKEPEVEDVEMVPLQEPQKATEEAKLLEMNKSELIKVVHEEAAKAGVDTKILVSAKGGQEFRKIQDAEIKVLNREHSKNIRKARELRKKRIEKYRWATSSRLKPETITDIHIYLNTKPVIVIVFRGNDQRNFNVFNPFKFGDFGTRIPGLECNRSLPEGIPFINNLEIEQPENGMFFKDVFGDEAFQRMSDIRKADVETLLTYLVMASNISTRTNQRLNHSVRRFSVNDVPELKKKVMGSA